MIEFTKPALTVEQQIELLTERGLIIRSPDRVARYLEVISFFRLSAYMRPFQESDSSHRFRPGVCFQQIVELYAFDRELRLIVMDAAERFEVAMRSAIGNHMGPSYGTHWYLDKQLFKSDYEHGRLLTEIEDKIKKEERALEKDIVNIQRSRAPDHIKQQRIEGRKKENYLRFYPSQYHAPRLLPNWAMLEELSFGNISHLYQGLAKDSDRKQIARRFNTPHSVLGSWLHTLTFIRNCCAHHARLWNRELSVPPKLLRAGHWESIPDRLQPLDIQPGRRIFIVTLILDHLIKQVSPESKWLERLHELLQKYPSANREIMGFPDNWQDLMTLGSSTP